MAPMYLFYCLGPNASISWWSLGGFCCFLVVFGWALVFPSGLLMDAGITSWSLYGRWYSFLVSGCMLMLFFGAWGLPPGEHNTKAA